MIQFNVSYYEVSKPNGKRTYLGIYSTYEDVLFTSFGVLEAIHLQSTKGYHYDWPLLNHSVFIINYDNLIIETINRIIETINRIMKRVKSIIKTANVIMYKVLYVLKSVDPVLKNGNNINEMINPFLKLTIFNSIPLGVSIIKSIG